MAPLTTTQEYREQLDSALANLVTEEGWARWLKFRSTQHSYSWSNTILALMQHPTASLLRGYGAKDGSSGWLAIGRQVRKGEKAIRIFAPVLVNHKTEKDANGKPKKILIGFKVVSVFDIDQTDGDPIPVVDMALPESEAPVGLREALESLAVAEGLTVKVEAIDGGAHGYLRIDQKLIAIGDHVSDGAACKVLAHELAHWFDLKDHESPMMEYTLHRGDAEAVAESVAYIVAQANGMSTETYSLGYIAGWVDGDVKRVKELAKRVDAAAQAILKALDGQGATDVESEQSDAA